MERKSRMEAMGAWIAAASFLVFGTMAADTALAATTSIVNSKHNLSKTNANGNDIYSTNVDEVCVFCHTPHGGDTTKLAPLWNRNVTASTAYTVYDGLWGNRPSSFDGAADAANNAVGSISLLCLSCHDGTTAMNTLINRPGSGAGSYDVTWSKGTSPANPIGDVNRMTNIGRDLRNDHPISVPYCGGRKTGMTGTPTGGSTGNCRDPDFNNASTDASGFFWVENTDGTGSTGRDKTDMILYASNYYGTSGGSPDNWPTVECGSCHDPHNADSASTSDPQSVAFLRIKNTGSKLCLNCHNK